MSAILSRCFRLGAWVLFERIEGPVLRVLVRTLASKVPRSHGFVVLSLQASAIARQRLDVALELFASLAPRQLLWLRQGVDILALARVVKGTGPILREWFGARFVALDWRWVSANDPEAIAVELVACATRARLTAAGFGKGRLSVRNAYRVQARGLEEKIALAEKLPLGQHLGTVWRERLAEFRALITSSPTSLPRR